jgi:hypothetical protein
MIDGIYLTSAIERKIQPNSVVHAERRSGKTEALLNIIHDKYYGSAIFVSHNKRLSDLNKNRYVEKYPEDITPLFISASNSQSARGQDRAIFCDEWFLFEEKSKQELRRIGIEGAVGTTPNITVLHL